jgi:hypothetical protein
MEQNNRRYIFFPYLRKGLNAYITEVDDSSLPTEVKQRGSVSLSIQLDCKKEDTVSTRTENVKLELVGPSDVKGINNNAILQVFPAEGSSCFSNSYMPFVEFFEEDFPWRYTPLCGNGKLRSWITLIVCKDDEFEVKNGDEGRKSVILSKPDAILPTMDSVWQLSHVQICDDSGELDGLVKNASPDNIGDLQNKLNEILRLNPDAGISRLMNNRKLEINTHYTAFIIPTFELGRLAGLGEKLENVSVQSGAWGNGTSVRASEFPFYYKWSFTTGSESFEDLANKLNPLSVETQRELKSYISAETKDCGLASAQNSNVIDVPVACRKIGDDADDNLRTESAEYQGEVAEWLSLSPTFDEDKNIKAGQGDQTLEKGDPWIVPPVYGAKHVLAETLNQVDWVKEMNTVLRHRIAAGLGKKIVQENQEQFVHRAWLQVEQINALNKRMREMLLMANTNKASGKKHIDNEMEQSRNAIKNNSDISSMSSDAFVRVLQLSNGSDKTTSEIITEVGKNMDVIERYCMDYYSFNRGIKDDFLKNLFNTDDTDIKRKMEIAAMLNDPVLCSAYNENGYESINAPKTATFRGIFDINYQGVEVRDDGNNKKVVTKTKGEKDPFVFSSIENLNQVSKSGKWNRVFLEELLIWLTGFDDIKGHKDYYDEKFYLNAVIRDLEFFDPKFGKVMIEKSPYLADHKKIVVRDTQGNLYPGYLVSDKYYQEVLHIEANYEIVKIEYSNNQNGETNDHLKDLYIIPWGSLIKEDGKINAKLLLDEKAMSSQTVKFDSDEKRFILKDCGRCSGHFADNMRVEGNVDKNHDVRDEEYREERTFELGPNGDELKYMSRYHTLCESIEMFKVLSKNQIFNVALLSANQVRYTYKNMNVSFEIKNYNSKTGWITFINNRREKKPYCHWLSISDKNLFQKSKEGRDLLIICNPDGTGGLLNYLIDVKNKLDNFARHLYEPDYIEIDLSQVQVQDFNAWTFVNGDNSIGTFANVEDKLINNFGDLAGKVKNELNETSVTSAVKPKEIVSDRAIPTKGRASSAALAKLTEILNKYYGKSEQDADGFINKLLRSKYPLMAFPQYPDPTYFYLRELSTRFILPSVNELPSNTISLFRNNPVFEEAFLCGMNTEMGKELLWREYPTDERGSYFRKFWDSEDNPCLESYHDVKMIHEWNNKLGRNHQVNKGSLLVFAIKGELMQSYPQTIIYLLSQVQERIMPVMSAWLTNDTFIVGFSMKEEDIDDKYLVFQERDTALHFDNNNSVESTPRNSAKYASEKVHSPYLWKCLISNKKISRR